MASDEVCTAERSSDELIDSLLAWARSLLPPEPKEANDKKRKANVVPTAECIRDCPSDDSALVLPPTPPSSDPMGANDRKRKAGDDIEEPRRTSESTNAQDLHAEVRESQGYYEVGAYAFKRLDAIRAGRYLTNMKPRNLVSEKMNEELAVQLSGPSKYPPGDLENQYDENQRIEHLKRLSTETPTAKQIVRLERAKAVGPNFLGRTASLTRGWKFNQYHRKTNGLTTGDTLVPSADTREDFVSHQRLEDLSQGELIYMIGNHLMWVDLCGDEFLSYSKDPLFLLVHALSRYHQRQGNVTIQFLDRRRARDSHGNPASFYNALGAYTAFDVPKWNGWGEREKTKLHPRKFTQEFLSHGVVFYDDPALRQARISDLIDDGLYEIFPHFDAPENHKRSGLYTLQVVLRKLGYPPPPPAAPRTLGGLLEPIYSYDRCSRIVPVTVELMETVRKVTLNFCDIPPRAQVSAYQPPLHILICFLTFEKRVRHDPVFEDWIKERYTAQDVLDLYTNAQGEVLPGFTTVANNLPGYMQYLDLVRDCIDAFDLTALPEIVVETAHVFDGTMDRSYAYAAYDDIQHRDHVASKPYDEAAHQRAKEKKRKGKKQRQAAEEQDSDDDAPGDAGLVMANGDGEQGPSEDDEDADELGDTSEPLGSDQDAEAANGSRTSGLIEAPSAADQPSWLQEGMTGQASREAKDARTAFVDA